MEERIAKIKIDVASCLGLVLGVFLMCFACAGEVHAAAEAAEWKVVKEKSGVVTRAEVVWTSVPGVSSYIVNLNRDGRLIRQKTTTSNSYDFSGDILSGTYDSGEYDVEIMALTSSGYVEFASDQLKVYKVIIDTQGHGSNIVLKNVQSGTLAFNIAKYGYVDTLGAGAFPTEIYDNGEALIGVALHQKSYYSNMSELAGELFYSLPMGGADASLGGNVTLYAIWFEVIRNVSLQAEIPACGTETSTSRKPDGTWDTDSQTNPPVLTLSPGSHCHFDNRGGTAPAAYWNADLNGTNPYIGTLKAGNAYYFSSRLLSDYGYVFPGESDQIPVQCTISGGSFGKWENDSFEDSTLYGLWLDPAGYGATPLWLSGSISVSSHNWDSGSVTAEPTCTASGIRTFACACGETKEQEIAAKGHSWNGGTITTPAGCTKTGVRTYACSKCGRTKTAKIAALGHKWENEEVTVRPTCTAGGKKQTACSLCGETKTEAVPAAGHVWKTATVKKATLSANGMIYGKKCTVCGDGGRDTVIYYPKTIKLQSPAFTYDGKEKKPSVSVIDASGKAIAAEHFTVSYSKNINAGAASAKIVFRGGRYTGSRTLAFSIAKAANPLRLKGKTVTVKRAAVKKKKQSIAIEKAVKVSGAKGRVTYAKVSGDSRILINKKTGRITIMKGLMKKKVYKVKLKVTAAGSGNYQKGVKTVTLRIRIK